MQDRLRQAGIRHEDVADRAGLERSYVSRQLRGERPMTEEVTTAARQLLRESERQQLRRAARLLERGGAPDAADRARLLACG